MFNVLAFYLFCFAAWGNTFGALLTGYLLIRYGKRDAWAFTEVMIMWDITVAIGSFLSLSLFWITPYWMFLAFGRVLLAGLRWLS